MINKYIVVCPNCGTKLITVCSNAASDTYCPQCYQQLPSELYTKERNNDEALEIIANNESLSEGFAETVVNQMANDDEAPHNAGSQLARAISCNDVNDALLALTGWSVDSLLYMVPPAVMDCPDGFVNFRTTSIRSMFVFLVKVLMKKRKGDTETTTQRCTAANTGRLSITSKHG